MAETAIGITSTTLRSAVKISSGDNIVAVSDGTCKKVKTKISTWFQKREKTVFSWCFQQGKTRLPAYFYIT
jgi:hypothetical protein